MGGGQSGGGTDLGLKYMGCYGRESQLGSDKVYEGGVTGARIAETLRFAASVSKRYIAIARNGLDGHAFAFNEKPKKSKLDDDGCANPCADLEDYACGCADGSCGDIQTLAGEDNMRRWVVYEIPLEAIQATLGNVGKPKKSKKKKKSSKSEL